MKEKDDPRPVHELEPPPQVVNHLRTEADMTDLERWFRRAVGQGPLFWLLLGGAAVVLAGIGTVVSSLSAEKSVTGQGWIDSVRAKTPEEQIRIADAHPKTPLADFIRLQAAEEEYRAGFDDLTADGKRESAGPRLKRALTLFTQVASEAPHDSPQAREAALAVARVHEARNELPEAIKQYRLVAETWKGSPEASKAESQAKVLEDPDSVQFYKDLYASRPSPSSLGFPGGVPAIPPPPTSPVAPGSKPVDLVVPDPSAGGKSLMPPITGPAGIDPPPPPTTSPTPAPTPEPTPAPTPAKLPDNPVEPPKTDATPSPK